MNPFQHPACNDTLRRPPGTTEEDCGDLPILRGPAGVTSFWKPLPIELEALNAGSAVMLTFAASTHPPVRVQVTKPDESAPPRRDELLQLAKDLVAFANKQAKDHPETGRLTNRLLDLIPTLSPPPADEIKSYREDAIAWKASADTALAAAKDFKARLETETEVRAAAEENLRKLHEFVTGTGDGWPLSGIAVDIRTAIEAREVMMGPGAD